MVMADPSDLGHGKKVTPEWFDIFLPIHRTLARGRFPLQAARLVALLCDVLPIRATSVHANSICHCHCLHPLFLLSTHEVAAAAFCKTRMVWHEKTIVLDGYP